eukprot:9348524-Pyramimonas_sp.AAC.1
MKPNLEHPLSKGWWDVRNRAPSEVISSNPTHRSDVTSIWVGRGSPGGLHVHILVVYMPISTSMYRFALCTTLLVLKGAVLAEHLGADGRTVESYLFEEIYPALVAGRWSVSRPPMLSGDRGPQ